MKEAKVVSNNDQSHLRTRHSDTDQSHHKFEGKGPYLPPIDWSLIGHERPEIVPIAERRDDDPLPVADIVVITWTSAEWFALDHVFINNDKEGDSSSHEFRRAWHTYTRGAENFVGEERSGTLWGRFQYVKIPDLSGRKWRVILFKSNSHLAHAPWIAGLSKMVRCVLADSKATRLYTIGTAGAARLSQSLGDAVVTNSGVLKLQRPDNVGDAGNGQSYRCPTWYPSTSLIPDVQDKLLFKLDKVANSQSFTSLFAQLKDLHSGDPGMKNVTLDDLLNEALSPEALANPKIESLEDSPLLTTDFYYVANGNNSDAYSFLEMDDAVIIRGANEMNVPAACIRNISDPIVPGKTKSGAIIPDSVRNDWSGMIYSTFGLYSSFNGALATWATIAGENSREYNPKRDVDLSNTTDPLEVRLAYQVRSCGTCSFFWPADKKRETYGPYTAFDFDVSAPYPADAPADQKTSPWVLGRTRPPSFPNGEIIDGCRKAPIMTLGINPNLTAFAPGKNGAPWSYPNFSSDKNTDAWAKYAWYYRYRSVYQEKLVMDFVKEYIVPESQIIADKNGVVIEDKRPNDSAKWSMTVRYDGDTSNTEINIPGELGDFPYMVFFDTFEPSNSFSAGDILAAKVAVPEGIQVEILQEEQGYYMQFVPSLNTFESYLKSKGHESAQLAIGEDVSQIDMVACASPHWNEGFLDDELKEIVNNCVHKNAWAVKQIVQSRPSVLYVVSESSWNMFKSVFGNFVDPDRISSRPRDNAYSLMRDTTDFDKPVYVNFDFTIDGIQYKHRIRLIITPHFSFSKNFMPQYRMSQSEFETLSGEKNFNAAITEENGFTILPRDEKHSYYFREIQLNPETAETSRNKLKNNFPDLFSSMEEYFYDPHKTMADVLIDMYDKGDFQFDEQNNTLSRTTGACKFCVNRHWQFKNECRYQKNLEKSPPPGYLEKVAAYIIQNGPPSN